MSKFVDEFRKGVAESDFKRDLGLETPNNIVSFDDIYYGEDEMQVLDVYKPKSSVDKKLPVIVSVHGGGWIYGDKEAYQFYCMSLAQFGFSVVNFTYRLAPENKFPASLEDTCKVFQWVLDNCEKYNFDKDNIFAVGDSAGGNLLALFVDMCVNENYRNKFEFAPPLNFIPRAVALNCGAYQPDMPHNNGGSDNELMHELLENGGTQEEYLMVNSVKNMARGFSPAFVMSCEGDFLLNQMLPICNKLIEIETPFVAKYYKDENEVLGHVFHCNIKSDIARKCNEDECRFFIENIKRL